MRKLIIASFLVLAFGMLRSTPVQAQFWKKIFSKEKKEKQPSGKPEVPAREADAKDLDKQSRKQVLPDFPEREKKSIYRIDLLLPINLNALVVDNKPVQTKPPDAIMPYINFYEGMLLAADTLAAMGRKIDVYVHDIRDPSSSIRTITSAGSAMAGTDLIIGMLQSNEIPEVAGFAKRQQVNFLSALSPSDAGIKDNPYFILVQPTLNMHLHQMIRYALKKYKHEPKVLLYDRNNSGEQEAYEQLTNALNEEKNIKPLDLSHSSIDSATLAALMDPDELNVVFVGVLQTEKAEAILKTLAILTPRFRIEVFGLPSWKSVRGLNVPGYYGDLGINYTTPFHYNYQSRRGEAIRAAYADRFGGIPTEMVLRGYESLYWMAHLLYTYGPVFNTEMEKIGEASFTKYDIKPSWTGKNDFLYFENRQLYIFRYQQGNMQVTNP